MKNMKNKGNSRSKTKKRRSIIKKGGQSKFYDLDGVITDITDTYKGEPIFRKNAMRQVELIISKKIMENPNPYIVNIYDVNDEKNTIDMELLKLDYELNDENIKKIQTTVKEALKYLHSINVMYIDWKYDNIGLSKDGNFKLFDFDASGIANDTNKEWLLRKAGGTSTWSPGSSHSWSIALINHITAPLCADNFICFLFLNNMLDNIEHINLYNEL